MISDFPVRSVKHKLWRAKVSANWGTEMHSLRPDGRARHRVVLRACGGV